MIADEGVIHNLEHGSIWVSNRDQDDLELVQKLNELTKVNAKVVVSPRPANEKPIADAVWGRLLELDAYDQQ